MWDWLRYIPMSALYEVLAILLLKYGNALKMKDTNAEGMDDALGNVMISIAPAIMAWQDKNESAVKKALRATRNAIDVYLNPPPADAENTVNP